MTFPVKAILAIKARGIPVVEFEAEGKKTTQDPTQRFTNQAISVGVLEHTWYSLYYSMPFG